MGAAAAAGTRTLSGNSPQTVHLTSTIAGITTQRHELIRAAHAAAVQLYFSSATVCTGCCSPLAVNVLQRQPLHAELAAAAASRQAAHDVHS